MVVYNVYLFFSIFLVFFSSNWFFIWVCLELSTLSLVVLLSYYRTPRSTEATVKYFIVQAVAGVVLLLGILVRCFSLNVGFSLFESYSGFSYMLILTGLFVKIAVVPNPFWFVDVVGGLSLVRGFYVVVVSKIVPVYLYSLVVSDLFYWVFVLVGLSSSFFGTVFGVNQTSLRKIISLSSVSHLGWMVVSFSVLSFYECFFVFLLYVVMVLPLFVVGHYWVVNNVGKVGNLYHNFFVVLVLLVSLLSLAGFPPLIGFFYKWVMFFGLVMSGSYLVSGVLVMFSLVSLYFYLLVCYNLYGLYLPNLKYNVFDSYFLSVKGLLLVVSSFIVVVVFIFYVGPVFVFLFV
uniref:NADH-ubiquinone oxidoreductase chain 2 n=1 Tax=Ophiarachnella gorgonia TaxID=1365872 RepID=A0A6C0FD78_9ECHI|nr:NADH dehydrogenase subunit 2 [Ophiarachnella gorgonia]QHT54258.1 NADH dehydrogenase subunit 2 [Ophiarachnella gorgonia]